MGGFSCDFEVIRTESSDRDARTTTHLPRRHAIAATLASMAWSRTRRRAAQATPCGN